MKALHSNAEQVIPVDALKRTAEFRRYDNGFSV